MHRGQPLTFGALCILGAAVVAIVVGDAGAAAGAGLGTFAVCYAVREAIIARAGGRKRWVTSLDFDVWTPFDDRFPDTVAVADELLETVETVIREAVHARVRCRDAELSAKKLQGDGPHVVAARKELYDVADRELDRLRRYRDALSEVAAAAAAAESEHQALIAAGYTEIAARDDLSEAHLAEVLTSAAADLRAAAAAAAEVTAALEVDTDTAMAEVDAAANAAALERATAELNAAASS